MPAHIHPPTPRALEGVLKIPSQPAGQCHTTVPTDYNGEPVVQLKHIIASGCVGMDDREIKGGYVVGSKNSRDKARYR